MTYPTELVEKAKYEVHVFERVARDTGIALIAEVERLRSIADSDAGAAGDGMRLHLENDRLRAALRRVKERVCGEALPNWENTPRTGDSRGLIADVCDIALGQAPNA
jgi:hypothetical protein